ncbi:hypothetical protein G7Y79_00007g022190 [Physcia stellaris]|nr:hypothetical protein G7Y79_00007g022190 [Physcia stellaris]
MIHNPLEWGATKLLPTIISIQKEISPGSTGFQASNTLIEEVARYIQDEAARPASPGGKNSTYWKNMLKYDPEWKQKIDPRIAQMITHITQPQLAQIPTGTDNATAFESAIAQSAPGLGFWVENIPEPEDHHYARIKLDPQLPSYLIKYDRASRPRKVSIYGQKFIISTILHLKWAPNTVSDAFHVLEAKSPSSLRPSIIGQIARYIYDKSQIRDQTLVEKTHWTSILYNDPAWTQYAMNFDAGSKSFPYKTPELKRILPVSAPQTAPAVRSPVLGPNEGISQYNFSIEAVKEYMESDYYKEDTNKNPKTGLPVWAIPTKFHEDKYGYMWQDGTEYASDSPDNVIRWYHREYVSVEEARELRRSRIAGHSEPRDKLTGLPRSKVPSGESSAELRQWPIPEEDIGLPLPRLDERGFLVRADTSIERFAGHKHDRTSTPRDTSTSGSSASASRGPPRDLRDKSTDQRKDRQGEASKHSSSRTKEKGRTEEGGRTEERGRRDNQDKQRGSKKTKH